mmetsp:Transcript_12637/g.27322  ORF Transcript_12637/g.27322 Transcript_12637/m.27322 type:complete len:611 (-) Transcript_12637:472-2304(-)|eukprot:CAMPEP_0202903544 /NCGR_PEP_ID=MMETSP1392-20130828/25090_1 /ASSEMBLY_ACC=CAM_ASM_000868 /TAXON_ID=225041 /ORGANISM="Chlamydomonas chlamydogama, Strain SAG 11-48b" /LENGTH=610 /DNA_ID=CAMNT_0049590779 /DNA_START=111 /DNA_END=1943 /DNA_ORIENTATION=-
MASSRPAGALDKDKLEALAQMDLVKVMRSYILSIVLSAQGYKALLVDKETMRVCSLLFGRTELSDNDVVFIERLDGDGKQGEGKQHPELKALVFCRPTRENIDFLKREIRSPRFQSYNFFFSNLLSNIHLQELAETDAVKEQVQEVQEHYGDFIALESHHFLIPCSHNDLLICPKPPGNLAAKEYGAIDRFVQGLSALFLAVRRRPVIRYQHGSENAQRLADSLYQLTYKQQYQIFDFGARSNPIVLILDRRDDPVTPLLTQWTYQAMMHELIGIDDGRLKLKSAKIQDPQYKDLVLDARQDDFYSRHLYQNYGEVGTSVKTLVEKFASTSEKHKQVESLEDMRRFVLEHTDFQRLQGNVTKHVNIMTELSEAVNTRNLFEVSMAEQELANPASNLTSAASYEELMRLLRMPGFSDKDKVKLAMLYMLRFESDNLRVRQVVDYLSTAGVRDRDPKLFAALDAILKYGGEARRAGDLYASRSMLSKAIKVFKGVQGVENVYTQHTPLLTATLTAISTDKLDAQAYPYMAGNPDEAMQYASAFRRSPPREVIVFIVGGSTYEEAKSVYDWNERNPHMRVILGGSQVLNSDSFLAGLTANLTGGADHTSVDIR